MLIRSEESNLHEEYIIENRNRLGTKKDGNESRY